MAFIYQRQTVFRFAVNGLAMIVMAAVVSAQAGPLMVAGSPGYDQSTGNGFMNDGGEPSSRGGACANNHGTAVGYSFLYVSNDDNGTCAVRWNASGTAATQLDDLSTSNDGTRGYVAAWAINNAGTAVGYSDKYVNGSDMGRRAVFWDSSSTAVIELDHLGTDDSGYTQTEALAINENGTIVGYAKKYIPGANIGTRAVRWDASGTIATELGHIGASSYGTTTASAYAINDAGTAVGYASKYIGDNMRGYRAVRWDASGTTATELGHLGTNSIGRTYAEALAINSTGTAVGHADRISRDVWYGTRAVRWDASGTTASELLSLGYNNNRVAEACAYSINDAGTVVGYSVKYVSGNDMGRRAVRWDASGAAVTELDNLGINSNGITYSCAYEVNNVGTAVGYSSTYVDDSWVGYRAVIWLPDASAIDLNNLGVVPVMAGGTWLLNGAKSLSPDGWVAGNGVFDPDGDGPLDGYNSLWVAQVGLGGTWTSATGGTWGRGPNWSTGTPAMQVGDAVFDLDAEYTVALDRDELTKTIALDAGTVTIDFDGHTLGTESGLSIAAGATLKGAGTIVSDVASAGIIAPGNSPGTLDVDGDLTSTGTLEFEIAGLASYDEINVSGQFTAGGTIEIVLDGYDPVSGDSFSLMSFGSFADDGYEFDLSQAELTSGLMWDTTAFATTGSISVVVPEPAALALLGFGCIGLLAFTRRRRK